MLQCSLIDTLELLVVADAITLHNICILKQITYDEPNMYLLSAGFKDFEISVHLYLRKFVRRPAIR